MKLHLITSSLLFLFTLLSLYGQQTKPIYRSEILEIKQISPNSFVHISYLNTQDFGKVGCNGIIVINGEKGLFLIRPQMMRQAWN